MIEDLIAHLYHAAAMTRIARALSERPESAAGMAILDAFPGHCDQHDGWCVRLWIAGATEESCRLAKPAAINRYDTIAPGVATEQRTVEITPELVAAFTHHTVVHFDLREGKFNAPIVFAPLDDAHRAEILAGGMRDEQTAKRMGAS